MRSSVTIAQDEIFFLKEDTKRALSRLGSQDEIVIYCGAGVSIDQTGVSWTQLIREVFKLAATGAEEDEERKAMDYLVSVMRDPRPLASIVADTYRHSNSTENQFLMTSLVQTLYKNNTWSTGQILRNVARYAIMAAMFGRKVTVITTNYDDYLERDLRDRFAPLKIEAQFPQNRAPRVFRTVHEVGQRIRRIPVHENIFVGGAGMIELIYLHGRIDEDGKTEGRLVLTEDSYARTRAQSQAILMKHFTPRKGKTKGLLVVGASLSDGPLIDALAITRAEGDSDAQVRVALTDLPLSSAELKSEFESAIKPEITTNHVRTALDHRGRHLGVDILWPASHSQSAQFLEELRVDVSARSRFGRADAYSDKGIGVDYASRLDQWSKEFMSCPTMTNQDFVHHHLSSLNETIKVKLREGTKFDPSNEILRLELWARLKPTSERRLTLIGNSVGPLLDRAALRHETFDRVTNSSIQAFLEGRPLLKSTGDLRTEDRTARWKTFFSVPIFVHVEAPEDRGGGLVPVGVLTLASTLSIENQIDTKWSVFHELKNKPTARGLFTTLKSELIPNGRILLSPELATIQAAKDAEPAAG